jgi:hypothetical protein
MSLRILSRADCGLAPPNTARLSLRGAERLIGVTVHCTVTPAADPVATWRQIQREYLTGNNVNGQKYGDLPYNDGITLDGRILQGREHKYVGAHATSSQNIANRLTLGVALIGTGASITPAAEAALRAYLYLAALELGHRALLWDHCDWRALGGISTACPDPPTIAFVAQLKAEARR